jgi:hypothetical protein
MWLNGTLFKPDPVRPAIPIRGATKADIRIAHRGHKHMVAERGREHVRQAIVGAYDIVQRWNYWKPLEAVEYRLHETEPDPARHGEGTTCRNAAVMSAPPIVVRLANTPRIEPSSAKKCPIGRGSDRHTAG